MLDGKKIVLVVSGGIAAYKTPDLIRRLRERGARVRCILTRGGAEFVTPLTLASVSGEAVYQDLFSPSQENEISHIQLARDADLVLVAPATANILARMAAGIADDLATTVMLAATTQIMVAPAMNVHMWENAATQANLETLKHRGITVFGPVEGEMACGETGLGRMPEPHEIAGTVEALFYIGDRLRGRRTLVTSGPTYESIDPVRYIANRSSGKQGHAIAGALARLGADTVLVSGPTQQPDPAGVTVIPVESTAEMLIACEDALPADVAVCAAAVGDWRVADPMGSKLKKTAETPIPELTLVQNPDILATLSGLGNRRPRLVVGFAAETEAVVENGTAKRLTKGCDWIVANDVSAAQGTFGGDDNTVHLITAAGEEAWPRQTKRQVAERLAERIAEVLEAAP